MSAPDDEISQLQREVERKFGRAVLRLQQYERLTKQLLAEQDVAGPAGEFLSIKVRERDAVAKKTLGQLVGDLAQNCLAERADQSDCGDESEAAPPLGMSLPWVRMRFQVELPEGGCEATQQRLADLVALRNELVHHFLDKHDLRTPVGCALADAHLDACLTQVDACYDEMRRWTEGMVATRRLTANFLNSPAATDFLVHGIAPDGTVEWGYSTIVNLLRDAEGALAAPDGWTSLQEAIGYIGTCEPEHTPKKYGCRSWRQILHESQQFEVRKKQTSPTLQTEIWYRSRT